jgi:hypothetical protein
VRKESEIGMKVRNVMKKERWGRKAERWGKKTERWGRKENLLRPEATRELLVALHLPLLPLAGRVVFGPWF